MTTPTPEEVLRKMRYDMEAEDVLDSPTIETKRDFIAMYDALQSLLAMPEKNVLGYMPAHSYRTALGYNQCLTEVRAIITERMVK